MDSSTETRPFQPEAERRIARYLESIDPILAPYVAQLAKPPYKNLSDPRPFANGEIALEPKDLVVVHLTDHFPEGGIIRPTGYFEPDTLSFTVHTTINSLAPKIGVLGHDWKEKRLAVLMPFEKVMGRVLEFNPGDTFFLDELELPDGSVILADGNQRLPYKSSGNAEVHFADFNRKGEELSGLQLATYEQMIRLGYFPQFVFSRGDWMEWSDPDGRKAWSEFCQRNGISLNFSDAPHTNHWTGQMEDIAYFLQFYKEESDFQQMQAKIEFGNEFLKKPGIPDKYKDKLKAILDQHQMEVDNYYSKAFTGQ